jgi:hypothetical protein
VAGGAVLTRCSAAPARLRFLPHHAGKGDDAGAFGFGNGRTYQVERSSIASCHAAQVSHALSDGLQPSEHEDRYPYKKQEFVGGATVIPISPSDPRLLNYRNRTRNEDQSAENVEEKNRDNPNGYHNGTIGLTQQIP